MDQAVETSAFNEGADARIRGESLHHNPYDNTTDRAARNAWKRGWFDVQEHFGKDARWLVKPLPLPV